MPRKRTPRLVGGRRKYAEKAILSQDQEKKIIPYVPKEKTEREKVADIISDACRRRCWFVEYGIPYIELGDIEERAEGTYIVRFRCRPEEVVWAFIPIAKKVCQEVGSEIHYIYETKTEFNLPFTEVAWVIQINEQPIWRRIYVRDENR